ncbi:hypothetical protein BO86DRAFT_242401 [Aspergillus japonicus CBS 114.51]|uniref:Uncharacterized protein n=1 Tax=Aspergillus japonicus CBS 114.51 TaxID=1448312 RepID=A0A8T8XA47_ASPJA|nr:hypothetical protein BO86DRAFT_242401 [Aspergillus japonicus CBS 114.51]RAH84392.1 hypothetical protein BO86DRAFT_242401 [Aspergillus japonicus CBS 114.51]
MSTRLILLSSFDSHSLCALRLSSFHYEFRRAVWLRPCIFGCSENTRQMVFEVSSLDNDVDFDAVPQNRVTMIVGRDQTVFWKGCNVTVYDTDSEGKQQITFLESMPDGQMVVRNGVKLYITQGKVKEEDGTG